MEEDTATAIQELKSPFPPRISPFAAESERVTRAYLREHGLLRSPQAARYYDSSRLGYLTAQIYPDAHRDRFLLIAQWFCVWTIFDDQLEKLADHKPPTVVDRVADAMLAWLDGSHRPGSHQPGSHQSGSHQSGPGRVPFATGFASAWAGIRANTSAAWQRRFLDHTRQYLAGCRWEAENRYHQRIPDLDSYMMLRRRFGGIRMAMDLSEFGGGYELPPEVHADPLIQELLDLLGDITLWSNDLFSIQVDAEEGNVSNIVFALQERHRCGLGEASGMTLALLEERLQRLRALETRLPEWTAVRAAAPSERENIARYAEGLRTWISGNIAWSRENIRYRTAAPRVGGAQPNFLLALVA